MKNDHLSKSHNITAHTTVETSSKTETRSTCLVNTFFAVSSLPEFLFYRGLILTVCNTRYTHVKKCSYIFGSHLQV